MSIRIGTPDDGGDFCLGRFARRFNKETPLVGELFAGLGAFKTMFDMSKAIQDAHDVATRDRAVIELQKEILSAQMAQAELIERVGGLEKQVAAFEKWDAEKEKYELCKISTDTFAYARKEDTRGAEPSHYICARCYEDRKRSILQRADSAHVFCPECKTKFRFDSAEAAAFRRDLIYGHHNAP